MTRQQKLDAFARKKGYPSYFAYRNARAKAEGYSSYAELRRARAQARAASTAADRPLSSLIPSRTTQNRPLAAANPASDLTRSLRMRYREAGRIATDNALVAARITEVRRRTQASAEALIRPVVGSLDELDDEVRTFFQREFRQAYAEGARRANPNWKPSSDDVNTVKGIADPAMNGMLQSNATAKRHARRRIPMLMSMDRPSALGEVRRRPFKAQRYRNGAEVSFDTYGEMTLRAATARAYNLGYLKTAVAGGAELFQVYDGADCGWTSHRDNELANGKVVTAEQAMEFPIAHPNCVRGFHAAPEAETSTTGGQRVARAARRIARESVRATVASNAIALARDLVTNEHVQQAALRVMSSGRADFLVYKQNLNIVARLYEHARKSRISEMGNITDLDTRLPPVVSARAVADDVMAWIDDFADGEEVPEHVLQILGVETANVRRMVVGDRMDGFTTMYNSSWGDRPVTVRPIQRRMPTRVVGGPQGRARRPTSPMTARAFVEEAASNAFYEWLGPRIPQFKYLRYTFPNVNRSGTFLDRPRRLSTSLGEMVKVTRTTIRDRGVINHLSLNPNGLLRLSLTKDPETGWITPTFRIIPPGPLHIMTKVNRGVKGNITSLSGEVRLITGQPLVTAVSGRFNLNLRKLGLNTLDDIKRLKLSDYKKFNREDVRGVSIAADLRARGFNLFDISRTFRLPWVEAEKLWRLADFELGELRDQLKAQNARKKFIVLEGGAQQTGPRVSNVSRPVLRVVDPDLGDPFGPGSRPSFAQRIQVPGSIQTAPARRAYIESKLTNTERERVANLRLTGDYSTIRHLRNRDRLTWEQIAVEMRMSIARVKKIYNGGTQA